MKITISGLPGSGKSTNAKLLAERLGYDRHSSGDFQRAQFKKMGYSYEIYEEVYQNHPELDFLVDSMIIEYGKDHDDFVFDSWMASYFIQESFKVFLKADLNTRALRIFKDTRKERLDVEKQETFEKTRKKIQLRDYENRRRWIELYDFDYATEEFYNLVIDTTHLTNEQVIEKIIKGAKLWLSEFNKAYEHINNLPNT
tara:strand:- start:341 stop:937 length:597 start_codon:yes stop_codon:yes gene_type:complete